MGIYWAQDFGEAEQRMEFSDKERQAEDADPVRFARERLGFEPDEKQELALRGGRRGIVLCTRQWGKSTGGGGESGASRALQALLRGY